MKLLRPSLLLFSSFALLTPAAFAGPQRAASSRPAMSRPSVSRSVGSFHGVSGVSRSSIGSFQGQRWTTNNFSRANFSRSNFAGSNLYRANLSRTNFSGANLRAYNNFNRGTFASSTSSVRNNAVLRSNNLGGQRNLNRIGDGRLVANNHRNGNGNWNGNGNGNWNHHHHHHGGSSIIFIGGFGYPYYFPSYYDYYPYSYYPSGYGDYYGYGSYPSASYAYSGGTYDGGGGVYQGGDPGVYQDDSNYQDDQSGGNYGTGSDSSVAEVQRVLSRDGFYHGSIDGVAGSRTFYAIRAYQRSHNLHADGQISRELLDAMGLH